MNGRTFRRDHTGNTVGVGFGFADMEIINKR